MATSVATPLERRLGTISGVNEITSTSRSAARASACSSISHATSTVPRARCRRRSTPRASTCRPRCARTRPTARPTRPTAPVIILALTSKTKTPGQIYDAVSNIVSQRLAQVDGVGDVEIGGGSLPAVRVELRRSRSTGTASAARTCAPRSRRRTRTGRRARSRGEGRRLQIYTADAGAAARADYAPMVVAWRNGAAVRLRTWPRSSTASRTPARSGLFNGQPAIIVLVTRQPRRQRDRDGRRRARAAAGAAGRSCPPTSTLAGRLRQHATRSAPRCARSRSRWSISVAAGRAGGQRCSCAALRATIVPAVATVVSLLGTFGVMYLLGFSLEQPEPDGADGGHRLRRRRRHRRAREHQPPHRGRHGPDAGRAARRARGRLHRALDQRLAGGGVHPAAVHGRARSGGCSASSPSRCRRRC